LRILLTGRNGQVGWELLKALAPLGEIVAPDRARLTPDYGTVTVAVLDLRLTFEPQGEPGVTSSSSSGLVVSSRAGLALAFGSPGLLRSYTALGAGLPLRSFEASDSGRVVTGASELELFASTGLALEFP